MRFLGLIFCLAALGREAGAGGKQEQEGKEGLRGLGNDRRFINGDVSLGDILPNLLLEIYALVKQGNYWKYIDRIFYISLVKNTSNVC